VKLLLFTLGTVFGLIAPAAIAQDVTVINHRDMILRATYCSVVVDRMAEIMDRHVQMLPPQMRDDARIAALAKSHHDNAERLFLYLSPANTQSVDAGDQLSAILRAKSDLSEVDRLPTCPPPGSDGFKACDEKLISTYPVLSRVRSCNDLSWLPF
jgi:hypothetical protein